MMPLQKVIGGAEGRIGIDVGSRSVKVCSIVGGRLCLGIADTAETLFSGLGPIPEGSEIVATGYGRGKVPGARTIPEIRAHAVGALNSVGLETFTLLDIGGQDFKVIRIDRKGIRDFNMNDKCAAGTGRFLEKMAGMLSMEIEDLGSYQGKRRVLESTCSVFTETELISLLMEGVSKEDLAGGVIYSVYERIRPYLRMYPKDRLVLTGGVARMPGIRLTLEEKFGVGVTIPEYAQFMGALGCYLVR
jgi:predicted CoA-substrate-specific enzyme activase